MTGEEAHWAGLGPEDCEPITAWLKREDGTISEEGFAYMQLAEKAAKGKLPPEVAELLRPIDITAMDSSSQDVPEGERPGSGK